MKMALQKSVASTATTVNDKEIRRVVLVTHGETVDKVFGYQWMKFYDEDGNLKCSRAFSNANYVTFEDGNLPFSLIDRADMKMYDRDAPLTEVGKIGSLELGYALGLAGVNASKIGGFVYCSPTCACIESAHYICRGLAIAAAGKESPSLTENDGLMLRIENGLVMHLGHDSRVNARNLPTWWTAKEVETGIGRKIDLTYKPAVPEFNMETVEECYARMRKTMDKLLQSVPNKPGQTLLIVGHPSTMEGCTRTLYNGEPRRQRDFDALVRSIPFCYNFRLSERSANTWQMTEPLVPGFTYSGNDPYRWEAFGDQNEMRKILKK